MANEAQLIQPLFSLLMRFLARIVLFLGAAGIFSVFWSFYILVLQSEAMDAETRASKVARYDLRVFAALRENH